jgi:hypothetical protein
MQVAVQARLGEVLGAEGWIIASMDWAVAVGQQSSWCWPGCGHRPAPGYRVAGAVLG